MKKKEKGERRRKKSLFSCSLSFFFILSTFLSTFSPIYIYLTLHVTPSFPLLSNHFQSLPISCVFIAPSFSPSCHSSIYLSTCFPFSDHVSFLLRLQIFLAVRIPLYPLSPSLPPPLSLTLLLPSILLLPSPSFNPEAKHAGQGGSDGEGDGGKRDREREGRGMG